MLLSLSYGCGLRAGEVVRLKVKHSDSAQSIIHIEQSKGRKDRNVMLSPEMLALLRQWWKVRPFCRANSTKSVHTGRNLGFHSNPRTSIGMCFRLYQHR